MSITHEDARKLLPEAVLFIGGQRVTTASGGVLERVNPTTGDVLGEFPVVGAKAVDAAVQAAQKAFPAWRAMPADQRRAGYVSVNSFPSMTASAPFGGTKISGFGREGGRAGIEEYVYHKNVYIPLG